jgi:Protein of unknown function (DUF3060)
MLLGMGMAFAAAGAAIAANNAVISVPGVEIGPSGEVQAPGVAIGKGKGGGTTNQGASSTATVKMPGVSIEQGGAGDGDVVITADGGNINTAVSNQNLLVRGDHNTLNGAGQVLTLTVEGSHNTIELRDGVKCVVVSGDDNVIKFPNKDAKIEDRGKRNHFPKG